MKEGRALSSFSSRDNNFNLLRVLLAVTVIFSHAFPVLYGVGVDDPVGRFLQERNGIPSLLPLTLGALAVNGFFVISGYLVTASWQNSPDLFEYFKKRILRIHPGYLSAVIFCLFVVGPIGATDRMAYLVQLKQGALHAATSAVRLWGIVAPSSFTSNPFPLVLNVSLWTIPYEFFCYVIVAAFGLAAACGRRWLPRSIFMGLPLLFFGAVYLWQSTHASGHWTGWLGINETPLSSTSALPWQLLANAILDKIPVGATILSRLLVYFVAGMCFWIYRRQIPRTRLLAAICLALLVAAVFAGRLIIYVLPICGSYLLIYLALLPSRFSSFGRKTDLSYGLYLYSFPIQQILVFYFRSWLNPWTLFLLSAPIAGAFAWLSWNGVEKPCLRFKGFPSPKKPGS